MNPKRTCNTFGIHRGRPPLVFPLNAVAKAFLEEAPAAAPRVKILSFDVPLDASFVRPVKSLLRGRAGPHSGRGPPLC